MENSTQSVDLIKGNFTPSEASDLLIAFFEHKINFHKLERLSVYAVHPDGDTEEPSERINELEYDKNIVKDFISLARRDGKNLKINSSIVLVIED
ncbi:hypothetical protein ACOCEA_06190 [Maribacter sp. CXY002]|uniref:hypothetical protein n=1 Tax=Maribacter luteocoastalis TaxID=3407671 RepID=UPI003B672763